MASQLAYCYSANRLGSHPFPLLVTSFVGRIRKAYENRQDWKSWKGVEWWEEPLEQLYQGGPSDVPEQVPDPNPDEAALVAEAAGPGPDPQPMAEEEEAPRPGPSTSSGGDAPAPEEPVVATESDRIRTTATATATISLGALAGRARSRAAPSTVVYLTGDSPNVLTALEPGHTYVLGGIVDRNRYKLLCLDKAERLGLRHAQLPIGDALPEMKTRKVLTVNQVVEILVKWVDLGQRPGPEGWTEALRTVMPTRKFDAEGKKKRREAKRSGGGGPGGDEAGAEDEEDDDGEEVYIAQDDEGEEEGEEDGNDRAESAAAAPSAATVTETSEQGAAGEEDSAAIS